MIKLNKEMLGRDYYFTSFYKIHYSHFLEFFYSIIKTRELYILKEKYSSGSEEILKFLNVHNVNINTKFNDIEYYLFCFFNKYTIFTKTIGLTQIFSCNGVINNI